MRTSARTRRPKRAETASSLRISAPTDLHEREADRAADAVLSNTSEAPTITVLRSGVTALKPAAGGSSAPNGGRFGGALASESSRGAPLGHGERRFFEPRFGRDLNQVRIHQGAAPDQLARTVGARAFTRGQHIFLRSGEPVAASPGGRRLLAHEIAHTLQQGAGGGLIQRAAAPSAGGGQPSSGGTVGGFFANIGRGIADIFGDEPDYSDDDLAQYLKDLKARDAIEDDFDSDNKARAVVRKKLNQKENLRTNILLVEELLSGAALDDDEAAVLSVLQFLSPAGRETLGEAIGLERLYDKFDGSELDQLYVFFPVLDSLHPRRGDKSTVQTLAEYIKRWNKEHRLTMSSAETLTLARGCIGITALEIGTLGNPDLSNCYEGFAAALAAQKKMDAYLAANQADRKAIIFSKRFWTEEKPPADKKTGKVDMSGYDYSPRPEPNMTNFDYGLYDEKSGNWWHANHCDTATLAKPKCGGAMEVYESTLEHYSRPLQDFNRQIFCVGVAVKR
ncbi:hypothetical protein QFZ27_001911 [Inquilinus ginsengisoli]|uniref:eCIS core domain-containing protein n=1 Tax=Inquilinus ginsengisoli TaxID=363840 RepID=UPI003D1A1ECE